MMNATALAKAIMASHKIPEEYEESQEAMLTDFCQAIIDEVKKGVVTTEVSGTVTTGLGASGIVAGTGTGSIS